MAWLNTGAGYGALTKLLHWAIAIIFAFQYVAGHIMVRLAPGGRVAGIGQEHFFNWHKSIGLLALALAVARLWARRAGELPPWAPSLSASERVFIHRAEQALYAGMLVMPVSGFLYTMAGGYGVLLFGWVALPNPIGEVAWLAGLARWAHVLSGWLLLITLLGHIGLVVRHQFILRDGLLARMLPRRGA